MGTGPSPHLRWAELACHDTLGTPYPLDWRETRLVVLATEFEAVRAMLAVRLGRIVPLRVLSAYRTWAYNRAIGGAPRSQHCYGRALDLAPMVGGQRALDELHGAALARALTTGAIRGLGRYDTFVHLDVRPAPGLVQWDERSQT